MLLISYVTYTLVLHVLSLGSLLLERCYRMF